MYSAIASPPMIVSSSSTRPWMSITISTKVCTKAPSFFEPRKK